MKKLAVLLILFFVATMAFASEYKIILDSGEEIECDSYREEGGKIYYEGEYGEAFVDKSIISKIIDYKAERSRVKLKAGVEALEEESIEKLFYLIIERFFILTNEKVYESNNTHDEHFKRVVKIDSENAKYTLDKTDSLIFPYKAMIFYRVNITSDHEGKDFTFGYNYQTIYRFDKNDKRWKLYELLKLVGSPAGLKWRIDEGLNVGHEKALKIQDELLK